MTYKICLQVPLFLPSGHVPKKSIPVNSTQSQPTWNPKTPLDEEPLTGRPIRNMYRVNISRSSRHLELFLWGVGTLNRHPSNYKHSLCPTTKYPFHHCLWWMRPPSCSSVIILLITPTHFPRCFSFPLTLASRLCLFFWRYGW